MTKEEILKQAQAEGRKSVDERDAAIQAKASYVGMVVGALLCLLLMAVKVFRDLPYHDVYAVICSICCAHSLYKWTHYKTKTLLAAGIIWGITAALLLVVYLLKIF